MKISAGLLIYKQAAGKLQVFLVHPGGPFWARKDAWGIPKGECQEDEDEYSAARREFKEETGLELPSGQPLKLGQAKAGGKIIHVFALQGNLDAANIKSNLTEIEWPPRSGKKMMVPEVDKAKWFDASTALVKIHKNQKTFVERLMAELGASAEPAAPAQGSLF
jgi:predicted NUDIX family NTP pyrophosphohydrolase